jgi:hypothetical protein
MSQCDYKDEDHIFTNLATVESQAGPADGAKPAAKPFLYVGPSDKDSVSTFRSGIIKRNKETSSPSSASKMSAVTTAFKIRCCDRAQQGDHFG